MMSEMLALIDEAVADWETSTDAMRWAPPEPPWDEPIVRDPRDAVERLLHEGYDGYAAAASVNLAWRRFSRSVVDATQAIADIGNSFTAFSATLSAMVDRQAFGVSYLRVPGLRQGATTRTVIFDEAQGLCVPVRRFKKMHASEPMSDLWTRALDARRNRNTGPDRSRADGRRLRS